MTGQFSRGKQAASTMCYTAALHTRRPRFTGPCQCLEHKPQQCLHWEQPHASAELACTLQDSLRKMAEAKHSGQVGSPQKFLAHKVLCSAGRDSGATRTASNLLGRTQHEPSIQRSENTQENGLPRTAHASMSSRVPPFPSPQPPSTQCLPALGPAAERGHISSHSGPKM